ncbi:hypothetical protein BDR26DRAFT_877101 [Obelidium mucronatum]|nr:hypothetical protein BDR26DRAFT_877101 [Obelidium mucronatum]
MFPDPSALINPHASTVIDHGAADKMYIVRPLQEAQLPPAMLQELLAQDGVSPATGDSSAIPPYIFAYPDFIDGADDVNNHQGFLLVAEIAHGKHSFATPVGTGQVRRLSFRVRPYVKQGITARNFTNAMNSLWNLEIDSKVPNGIMWHGDLSLTLWANALPQEAPLEIQMGDSTSGFSWANPMGTDVPPHELAPGTICLVAFLPRRTGSNNSPTLQLAWLSILKLPANASPSKTPGSSSHSLAPSNTSPSKKKNLRFAPYTSA